MSSYSGGVKNRKRRALERLEAQLKSGNKPEKMPKAVFGGGPSTIFVTLTEQDRTRIQKEISTLKTRI